MELLKTYVEESPNISLQVFSHLHALSKEFNKGVRNTHEEFNYVSSLFRPSSKFLDSMSIFATITSIQIHFTIH